MTTPTEYPETYAEWTQEDEYMREQDSGPYLIAGMAFAVCVSAIATVAYIVAVM